MDKVKPFMFLQKGFFDADYLVSVDGDKLNIEYIVDFAYGWRREVCLFKIIGDDIHTRTLEYETADDYSVGYGQGFKSYYTVRNGIHVDEQPKDKYKSRDLLERHYFEEKWGRAKFIGKETVRSIEDCFTDTAKTYIFYHALGKDKAKEYGEKAIKRLETKSLMKYKKKLEDLYEKYGTRMVYDGYERVDFDASLVPEKKWDKLWEEEQEITNGNDMYIKQMLSHIEEIKYIMENGNVPDDGRERSFKEDCIRRAEYKANKKKK